MTKFWPSCHLLKCVTTGSKNVNYTLFIFDFYLSAIYSSPIPPPKNIRNFDSNSESKHGKLKILIVTRNSDSIKFDKHLNILLNSSKQCLRLWFHWVHQTRVVPMYIIKHIVCVNIFFCSYIHSLQCGKNSFWCGIR